eukprot:GCRY01002623.1.p1 GENE.GCRY01002623.1~~GCRY01002623.1.p1  ORF type:complete len:282 (-),score=18.97 GCRY01002623.1:418-1263(-)
MEAFIDTHCHLQDFSGDLFVHIESALANSVKKVICCSTSEKDFSAVKHIAITHPDFAFPFFGIHPWYADQVSENWLENLRQILINNPQAGVGEIGLCRTARGKAVSLEQQELVFRKQIALAKELKRPISIHCVRHYGKLLEILSDEAPIAVPFSLHSYGGGLEMLKPFLKLGAFFGFSCSITNPNSTSIHEVAKHVPLDRVLFETDAPYLPPSKRMDDTKLTPEEQKRFRKKKLIPTEPVCEKSNLDHIVIVLSHFSSYREEEEGSIKEKVFENSKQFIHF